MLSETHSSVVYNERMNNLLLNIIVVIFNKRLCASVLFRNVLVRSVSVMTDDKNYGLMRKRAALGKLFFSRDSNF